MKSNSVLSSIINPSTRQAANAAYTVKQWSNFAFATNLRYQHHVDPEMKDAYQHLLQFTRYAGESGATTIEETAAYLNETLGITGYESMIELFEKENREILHKVGFHIPVICISFEGKAPRRVTELTKVKEEKEAPKKRGSKKGQPRNYFNTPINVATTKKNPVCLNGKDHSKKYGHQIPEFQGCDARVNPEDYTVLYDTKGVGPIVLVKMTAEQKEMGSKEKNANGYNNAIRYKYAQQFNIISSDVRPILMVNYQNGKYPHIAAHYGKHPSQMPGIKKAKKSA